MRSIRLVIAFVVVLQEASGQHSVARIWNEAVLTAIRNDLARPTVHARNLFHTSVAMYDCWAAYDVAAQPYLLGRTVGGFTVPFEGVPVQANVAEARNEAISFAVYRLLKHRFRHSPRVAATFRSVDSTFLSLGYDSSYRSTSYLNGPPAALGNYVAASIIAFGLQDGSNEENDYANRFYRPVNSGLIVARNGPGNLVDANRWQPLTFDVFIDQSGNVSQGTTPAFLSPEWGLVVPFSLLPSERTSHIRDGFTYYVYHDPGPPPYIDITAAEGTSAEYAWGFELVSVWSGHLDPSDTTMVDVSPASIGNIQNLPETLEEYQSFYDRVRGGDSGKGYTVNPVTGLPYTPQHVRRGDYARVLAEFWADGPQSETPPGHWFTILNYVNDLPLLQRRFKGMGPDLDQLEWDVKAYFILGGAMHDVAITAWGIKGRYDYIRPVSALRSLAQRGQCSDPALPSYHPAGIHLIPGWIELISPGDPLAGFDQQHVGKIKVRSWRGPNYVFDPRVDVAGVGWIRAEQWWPYQRPTFVTPPFAGYISGHSTFSRAAAEVLTLLTGDEYFPGGMGEFLCEQNGFLVFEDGPSTDVVLQWAKYRDASDQCSLSRIWGGIHPPADDIPGRKIGAIIGPEAFAYAERLFLGQAPEVSEWTDAAVVAGPGVYPNPVRRGQPFTVALAKQATDVSLSLYDILGREVWSVSLAAFVPGQIVQIPTSGLSSGVYLLRIHGPEAQLMRRVLILR